MSLNRSFGLRVVALQTARELRERATRAEQILWEAIRTKRLSGLSFYRQKPIYHDHGGRETFFVADFYCHSARLVIELDGDSHQDRQREDALRTEILNDQGLRVIRFSNEEVLEGLPSVLRRILNACGDAPPSPSKAGP